MIILKPTTDPQVITIFARFHEDPREEYDVIITSEETQVSNALKISGSYDGITLTFPTFSASLKEARFYTLRTYHPITGNLLNFSKIFVTDQIDLEKFSVVEGWYKQPDKPEEPYIVKKSDS